MLSDSSKAEDLNPILGLGFGFLVASGFVLGFFIGFGLVCV